MKKVKTYLVKPQKGEYDFGYQEAVLLKDLRDYKTELEYLRMIVQEVIDFGRLYYFRKKILKKLGFKVKLIKRK